MEYFNMNSGVLLSDLALYVAELFAQHSNPQLLYHNLEHTQDVVRRAIEIAVHYNLPQPDLFILSSAAWFHDTGHLFGGMARHEQRSAGIMKRYFEDKAVSRQLLHQIEACILATRMPSNPATMLEKIICDADTYHLGTEDFLKTDTLIYLELEMRLGCTVTDRIQKSICFLEMHRFYTDYCQERLSEGKQKNRAYLECLLPKMC